MQMLSSLLWILAVVKSPAPATEARYAREAELLFQDGQARLEAGKYGTAALAFQALYSVYPESPLADRARWLMQKSEALEQAQAHARTVRSIRFAGLHQVSVDEILQRFQDREVGLAVEEHCRPQEVLAARTVLAELLAEKGVAHPKVNVAMRHHSANRMDITFYLE
jgi:hypothetical protein